MQEQAAPGDGSGFAGVSERWKTNSFEKNLVGVCQRVLDGLKKKPKQTKVVGIVL